MSSNISPHISYAEATKSAEAVRLGIPNVPTKEAIDAMRFVAAKCFEPLRAWHGKPIAVTSFYRSKAVNKAIGGALKSQHVLGEAIDIDADVFNNGITNAQVFDWLRANVPFDQLIWEFGDDKNPAWVHVSYSATNNRRQVLRARRLNGKTIYEPFVR